MFGFDAVNTTWRRNLTWRSPVTDLADHPFSKENRALELGDNSDAAWDAWTDRVEHHLDLILATCDQARDGCSLDEAYDWFCDGMSAGQYADHVLDGWQVNTEWLNDRGAK